jgi:hypothetical protein
MIQCYIKKGCDWGLGKNIGIYWVNGLISMAGISPRWRSMDPSAISASRRTNARILDVAEDDMHRSSQVNVDEGVVHKYVGYVSPKNAVVIE